MTRQAPSAGFVALCITAVVAIVACGNASQAGQAVGGGRPSAWGPLPVDVGDPGGTASGQVTFTPNTVVITASQVRDSLTGVSADGSTYTFSSDSGPLGDLAPGKVMLLESLDAARVTSVNHDGSTLVVNTSPISLSDLIQSGSIDESGPPDLSGAFASEAGADTTSQSTATLPPGATSSASATATQSAARTGVRGGPVELTAFSGSGYTYSNKSGDLAYSITLTGGADGIHAVGGFCFSSDGSGSVTGTCSGDNVYLKGDLTGLLSWQSQSAKMTMAKGQPSKGSLSMSGLSAQLTVTYVALRGKAGQIASKLPAFEIPFTFEMPVCPAPTFCAGVPLYMKVQLSVLITLGISAENASMQGGFSAVVAGSGSAVDQTESSCRDPQSPSARRGLRLAFGSRCHLASASRTSTRSCTSPLSPQSVR